MLVGLWLSQQPSCLGAGLVAETMTSEELPRLGEAGLVGSWMSTWPPCSGDEVLEGTSAEIPDSLTMTTNPVLRDHGSEGE